MPGDQTIAPEQRDEPRYAARRNPHILRHIVIMHAKGAHIFDRLPIKPVQVFMAGLNRRGLHHPSVVKFSRFCFAHIERATRRRSAGPCLTGKCISAAGMPGRAWLKFNVEDELSVRVIRR